MSSQPCEDGESWDKQFKRAVVAGGPLKGARYTDVGWDGLRKAAKSYRGDARFNQYAKRCLSERAFAISQSQLRVMQRETVVDIVVAGFA